MRISAVLYPLHIFNGIDGPEILLLLMSLALTAFGVFTAVRPRPLAEWELSRRTDAGAEPAEDWLFRLRIGGALLALCGLAMLGVFIRIITHGAL